MAEPVTTRILLHRAGPALWPERYDEKTLIETREASGEYLFGSLFQQSPVPKAGGMFQADWFLKNIVPSAPREALRCRFWDLAASDGKGDWTVGLLMAAPTPQGPFYVEDLVRGRWGVEEVDRRVLETARADRARFGHVLVRGEQEPGRSGVAAAVSWVKMLAGFDVAVEPVSGSKEDRARPAASQAGIGNVKLVAGGWNAEFVSELARFPRGKHDDIVDSFSGALNILALGPEPPGPCHTAGKAPALSLPGAFGLSSLF